MSRHSGLPGILIVDDEPLARDRARRLLEKIGDVEIIGEATCGREALELIESLQPDVVLMDIQMPDIDGMRVLEALDDPPAVIFSTAYEHHAVRAFELDAVDYLLKPYSAERLSRALDRVRRQFALVDEPATVEPHRISVEDGLTVQLLSLDEISGARIEEGVVFVLRRDGERVVYANSLNDLEEELEAGTFFRASRQAIINVKAIDSYTPLDGGGLEVRLAGGFRQNVSRRRARALRTQL